MAVTSKEFDFNRLFGFPFKQEKAFVKVLIGWVVSLLASFIPILPNIILLGYAYRIMSRDINGDGELEMPEWTDWGSLIRDGFKLFVVNLVYNLPAAILVMMVLVLDLIPIILMVVFSVQQNEEAMLAMSLIFFAFMILSTLFSLMIVIVQLLISFLTYPAFGQAVAEEKIAGGFHFKAWWAILRKNFVGYLIVVGVLLLLGLVSYFVFQILILTIIGMIVIPAIAFLIHCYTYALVAEAYVGGREILKALPAVNQEVEETA